MRRRIRWAGHIAHSWEEGECIYDIYGGARRKWPLIRPRCSWVDNIKMDLTECGDMDWIELAQDKCQWRATANTVVTFQVP
jgi:hypothetical protein